MSKRRHANPTNRLRTAEHSLLPLLLGGIKLCSTSDLASVDTHRKTHAHTHSARLLAVLTLFLERESDTQAYISFLFF